MRNTAIVFACAFTLFAAPEPATADHKNDLIKAGVVTVETTSCWEHMFESLSVKEGDGETAVYGDIAKHHGQSAGRDALRISIVDPAGNTVAEQTVTWRPKNKTLKQQRGEARFVAIFNVVVSRGSVVKIACLAQHDHR